MIGKTISRFRIVSKLGEGGMGTVWRAEDTVLGRHVALKLLKEQIAQSEDFRRRFLREARAASDLDHPGIATVFEANEVDGQIYIAFQLVQGKTIRELAAEGPLPVDRALSIALSAAEALGHAHAKRVVHRDVTSGNIMVEPGGRVVVVDFGLALPEEQTRLTMGSSEMGTPAYMAPETALGEEADQRTDLYGLGVVLYEMLTGRLPFAAPRLDALIYACVHEKPRPPSEHRPGISPAIDRIVLKLLEKKPEDRYQSALELGKDLSFHVPAAERDAFLRTTQKIGILPLRALRIRGWTWKRVGLLALAGVVAAVILPQVIPLRLPTRSAPLFASVAVLPLQERSENSGENMDPVALGIADALATKLSNLADINVITLMTTKRYRDTDLAPKELAAELGVESLIWGTFWRYRGRIHTNIQLIDGATGAQRWGREFEDLETDLQAAQSRIAMWAAKEIVGELTGREIEAIQGQRSGDPVAYLNHLNGAGELVKDTQETDELAFNWFQRALEIDPQLAEAYVGVGSVYYNRVFKGRAGYIGGLGAAEQNFDKALEIVPDLIPARRGLFRVYGERSEHDRCLEAIESIRRIPGQGIEKLLALGEAYYFGGLADKAVPVFQEVLELDRMNQAAAWFLPSASAWAGEMEIAVESGMEYFRRFGFDPEIHTWMGFAYCGLGDYDRAKFHFETAMEMFGDESNVYVNREAGFFYALIGELERAREIWAAGLEMARRKIEVFPDNYRMRNMVVIFSLMLGDRDTYLAHVSELADEEKGPVFALAHCVPEDYPWKSDAITAIGMSADDLAAASPYDVAHETSLRMLVSGLTDVPTGLRKYLEEYSHKGEALRNKY